VSAAGAHLARLWPGHDVTATLDDDEEIKDVVRQHRVVLVVPFLVGFLGLAIALVPAWPRVADIVGLVLFGWAAWHAVLHSVDRFVITNHRVFRVRGVLRRSRASMPVRRVLDITVHKPLLGLLLGYGHFVFESAAQEQGLREIRFVGAPDERERVIQRLIHPRSTTAPQTSHCPGCRCAHLDLVRVADSGHDSTISWSTEPLH
jgi:membrane protein YdbS with pleckstrin-like domain